jgi:sugar/nucleoside kinase (ribokinase family)
MAREFAVAALGNAIVDVIAPVDDDFLLAHNIAKGVMTLVDEYRAHQLYQAFGERRESAGGSAANTSVGVASLGVKALFIGKVKEDRLGESFAESLKGMGVHYATAPAPDGSTASAA